MEFAIIAGFILASVAYVAWPFLNQARPATNGKSSARLDDLRIQRDIVFAAIKDLEMDREMGRVSEDDFEQLNAGYRKQAIEVLKKIDQAGNGTYRKHLEEELAALRSKHRQGGLIFCSACGSAVAAQDKFCSSCGRKLTSESN